MSVRTISVDVCLQAPYNETFYTMDTQCNRRRNDCATISATVAATVAAIVAATVA